MANEDFLNAKFVGGVNTLLSQSSSALGEMSFIPKKLSILPPEEYCPPIYDETPYTLLYVNL